MSTRPAIVTAIGEAAAAAAPAPDEQLELLPPTRFEPGDEQHGRMLESVKRQRAGRPPGARNLATRDAVDLVRRLFGDPLVESARWLLHSSSLRARLPGSRSTSRSRSSAKNSSRSARDRRHRRPRSPNRSTSIWIEYHRTESHRLTRFRTPGSRLRTEVGAKGEAFPQKSGSRELHSPRSICKNAPTTR